MFVHALQWNDKSFASYPCYGTRGIHENSGNDIAVDPRKEKGFDIYPVDPTSKHEKINLQIFTCIV